jgi:hypothetical protein
MRARAEERKEEASVIHPFRVFLSYAHEDSDLANRAAQVLADAGLVPLWDRDIRPGTPFPDAIKGLVARAHLFMPIITEHAAKRPWVHQETGYAMALNIPVLPVAVDTVPGEMVAQLQAIVVRPDLADFGERLAAVNLERVVASPPSNPQAMVEVTTFTERRTELLAQYARQVMELGTYGRVRQRAALSSYSIPDVNTSHALWALREGDVQRSSYQRHLQREERRALELHARHAGCDLIVDPAFSLERHVETVTKARLWILAKFLRDMPDDKVRIVLSSRAREGNLTIVGDWFSAESMSPHPTEGHRQTVFSWHAPTVLQTVRRFDEEFAEQCAECPEGIATRQGALARIDEILAGWAPS